MRRRRIGLVALLVTIVVGLFAGPATARTRTQTTQGITKDEVSVVLLMADVDRLRQLGVTLSPKQTVKNFTERWTHYFNSIGKVNGRTIKTTTVTWDPSDPTSFDKACLVATQDNKPFIVMQGSGYRTASIGCIAVDNATPFWMGDSGYNEIYNAAAGKFISMLPPGEAAGTSTVNAAVKSGVMPKGSKMAILSSNDPGQKVAGDAAEVAAKKAGVQVVQKTELNVVGADLPTNQRDATASVAAMKAAGAQFVVATVVGNYTTPFAEEVIKSNAGIKMLLTETGAGQCGVGGAARVNAAVANVGAYCATAHDTRALPTKTGVKPDSAFEAQCRADYDAGSGLKAIPGVPSGDVKDVTGATLSEDFSSNECTLAYLFTDALKRAGKNPTYNSVLKAARAEKPIPMAYMSDGKGSLTSKKNYISDFVHFMQMQLATATTPKDPATGLYNGCPAPVNCMIPVPSADGREWFTIAESKKG